ncbi:hypothetical protein Gorai_021472 [Gossypium raimondii]|uniref:Uncharacterized protein n=1 Tax=Gossypium raimondii TaxID=29730 RepID=A0A7J8NQD3_GOSRA|nr:hypothetical protein [Gossypium raimondii]
MLVERKSRRRPLTVTKEIVDSIDARAEGSRFSVLSKNYDEVEGIKCTALNGSTGIKGSDGAILGKGELSALPIDWAIDALIKGLCQEVENDTSMVGGISMLQGSDNETLVYAKSA